jgi:glycosyltransferase involved in cell wall biosynthesis
MPAATNMNSNKPLASVQMFAYNHAPYIRRAVDSVLAQQTDFPFEVVIGEDCSSDGTREMVMDYQRRFPDVVRVVTSGRNVGMHRNVLRTQHACRGDFLAFCEGDDFWSDPTKLQTQVEFLRQNPSYGLVHSNYDEFEVGRNKLRAGAITSPEPPDDEHAYLQVLLRQRRIMTLTVCVRRDLLDRVVREQPECTDERWPMGDTQRWLEVSRLTKVKYFPQAMATYNYLPESASQSRDPGKALHFTEKAGQLILHYLEKYPIEAALADRVRRRVGMEVLAVAYRARNRDRAAFWLGQVRQTAGPMPLEAYLYFLGTGRAGGGLAARPTIWFLWNWRRAKDWVQRICRGQMNPA